MVNQSVIDSSVNLEQLKDIEDLIPNIDKAISEKVETFLDKSGIFICICSILHRSQLTYSH